MQDVTLTLKQRDVTGKAVKRLRRDGMVPAVIHDHGKDSIVVMAPYLDMAKAYQQAGKHHPVSLKAGDKHYTALIKTVSRDPKKNSLTHVVFNAVKANQKVDAQIPVRIKYAEDQESTPAERSGLVVLHQLEEAEVEALPRDLPEALYFDGEKLVETGDSLTVADLAVPDGVTIKTDPAHPVATVFEPSALQAANEAAGGTEEEEAPEEGEAEGEEGGTEEAEEENKSDEIRPGGKKEFEDKQQGHNPEKR